MHLESYRTARWLRTVNLVLQAVLFVTLFAGLNHLARLYVWRFDFTQQRRYSLSPETLSYLHELKRPVRIVVTLRPDAEDPEAAQAFHDMATLLREYVYATQQNDPGRVRVEYLDVFVRRREADALGIEEPDVLLLLSGEHRRIVRLTELYQRKNRIRAAFQGEQAVTAAILDVSNPEKKKVFFLAGHGELRPDDVSLRGVSGLRDELRQRNYEVGSVDLSISKRVPEDASLLLIFAPQGPLTPAEAEMLRQYLSNQAGRIILTLFPGVVHGLDDLLYDWGVRVDDNLVLDTNPEAIAENLDFIIREFDAEQHPVTKTLVDFVIPLRLGPTRSVRPDPGRPVDNVLKVTVLAASSSTSWSEKAYRRKEVVPPPMDERRRLGVIVSSERVTAGALPFSVPGGRLVVAGCGDIFSNQRLANPGNQALCLNAVNWAVNRDTQLSIPPRPIQRFQLSLSRQELSRLRLGLLGVLPGSVALLGLLVYWTRRR